MVSKSGFIYVVLALTIGTTYAGWMRGYGREGNEVLDGGMSVQQTSDGGYIIAGHTGDTINLGEVYLIKTDSLGDTLWTKAYGNLYSTERGQCVCQTSDGGYIVFGFANEVQFPMPRGDIWLLKTDANGDTAWTRLYAGSTYTWGGWVEQTLDGGYIITSNWNGAYLLLLKTDKDGNTAWSKNYQWGDYNETGYCVRQTWDGGYIIATNMGLFKTDENGDSMWLKSVPSGCVDQTSDYGYIQATSHNEDIWIIKTDWKGDTIWTKTYGGTAEEYSYDVHQTTDGGYIVIANTRSFGAGNYDAWLLKTDANGDTVWTRTYGWERVDQAYSVQQTTDGGYVFTGNTSMFSGDWTSDVWLVKTDSLGYVGVEEPAPVTHQVEWQVVTSVGRTITLRYENHPQGFRAIVYDATGRKVDEIGSTSQSGTITWPVTPVAGCQSGVYFVREESEHNPTIRKVILIR